LQKKKNPFIITREDRSDHQQKPPPQRKRSPQPPLYIENILKEADIPPERHVIDRKVFIVNPEDNMSPSTNSTTDTGVVEFDRNAHLTQQSRSFYDSVIYDPSHSLRLISGIASEREFGSEDYELLLQLDAPHRVQTSNVGLDDNVINSFKFWKVNSKDNPSKCSICLHDVKIGQIARELPCNHVFHKTCIDKWLRKDPRCPLDNINMKDSV